MSEIPARLLAAHERYDVGFCAPGRANLIGEHTDYNEGFVLPVALDLCTYVVGTRADGRVSLTSMDEPGDVDIDLDRPEVPSSGWGRYAGAVVRALSDEGVPLQGLAGTIASDVPIGSGLSSSAALEVAIASAVVASPLDPVTMARICRRAENHYVGVQTGIMDQLAAAGSRAGHAMLIDCRSNQVTHVELPGDLSIVVVDSGIRRGLSDSAYNERRRECEEAAGVLEVASLRDVTLEALIAVQPRLSDTAFRRARHVVTENQRVLDTVVALRRRDYDELRRLFAASHASLATDYAVSTEELDTLVECAIQTPGVVAARLTGAGFGGCTVNLVHGSEADRTSAGIAARYRDATGLRARAWVTSPGGGARAVAPAPSES